MSRYLLAAFLIIIGVANVFGLANAVVTTIGYACAIGAGIFMLLGQ